MPSEFYDSLINQEPNDFYIKFIMDRRNHYEDRLKKSHAEFQIRNCKKAISNCDSMLEKMKKEHPEYFI